MSPTFFETPADFRVWLAANHTTADHLWVGFYKKVTGRPSVTWPEAVDEALCYGWIDSTRKSVDAESYTNRFTPRRAGSVWSSVNVTRVQILTELGRMQPTGLAVFEARKENQSGLYSYELGEVELPDVYRNLLRENAAAWAFYETQPASYRKSARWWVVSAKKEETRRKRLDVLIAHSTRAERLPQFTRKKPAD